MPESVAPNANQQPSFTSSTYQAIASNTQLTPTSDRPLADQSDIQAFLNAPSGPVPEILLYRLLTVAELYLEQRFPEKQLSGLCVGYSLISGNQAKFYYVSWGWIPAYSDWIEAEKTRIAEATAEELSAPHDTCSEDADILDQPVSDEDIEFEKLAGLIEEELNREIKDTLSPDQKIRAFLISHLSPAQRSLENLFPDSFDTYQNQFTVLLPSSSDLKFDADGTTRIPLNQNIELNPDIHLNITRTTFNFALAQASVRASQACHTKGHSTGRFKYKDSNRNHSECTSC